MEPPSNHLTSPYGSPPGCPPTMYGPNTDYNLQHKMQDQYYNDTRQQSSMGYPMSGQNYPSMGMEQSKMAADPSGFASGAYGPMMRALTEDDLYNQQQPQQAPYRQMPAGGMSGYGQNINYPSQEGGYGAHSTGGQYPFSPGHSPRSSQFFPMHGQSDGYTSPPVQSSHFGPNGPLGQYQRQSPLMNMASPNGQSSPGVPPYSRPTTTNHPVSAPSPVLGMQGSNSMYSSHTGGNSGHLSHNSPLPSPSNLRSPASVHSPKSLPATSPSTFASPSPSPVGMMAGQTQHRQTRSPGASGPFQQNPGLQPYPIPSPKVRAVEQASTVSGNTPYVELVSTRDSPHGSTASNNSQDSGGSGRAPYPPKEQSANRGHLPQLEEMVKFLGEPTAKGILYDKDNQPREPDVNGRNSVEDKMNYSVETDSNRFSDNNDSKSVSPSKTRWQSRQHTQSTDSEGDLPTKRRRSSSGERGERRRQGSGGNNVNQRSPKRRNSLRKSDDEMISNEASPKRLPRSPRRHSLEKPDPTTETPNNGPSPTNNVMAVDNKEGLLPNPRTENCGENNPSNGAKSETGECDKNRTIEQNIEDQPSGSVKQEPPQDIPYSDEQQMDVKSESLHTSPMDVPSTSRTLKRNSPGSPGSSGPSTPRSLYKKKGRPVGSKNRTKEEIERDKLLPKKKRPYKRRNIDPELQQELGKFKHVAKGGKVADNKQSLQKGPVLRIQGTVDNVVSSKVLNCPLDEASSQKEVGKKQKKKTGRVAKRYSTVARAVPHGPATVHASEFRPVGEWVCALCGKTSNVGTLGHLYGPYYPHGYQIPPQPPKTDSTAQTKEEVEEVEAPPSKKGKGRARLKVAESRTTAIKRCAKGKGAKQQTPQSGTTQRPSRYSKGASGKRTPKAAKMEDFDYEYETPGATKGGQRRRRRSSATGGSSSRSSVKSMPPEQAESGRKRRKSLKGDPRGGSNEIWVHEDCAIWAQGVYSMGSTLYGLYEAVLAAKKVECVKCNKKGASMGCLSKGCKKTYHFMCAQQAGCQLQDENYSMICPEHKDKMVKMRDVT
ncbi:LOW QUALITY PROTEIN: uncharacterized protein [Amphiura filiformis]|uniref:LOW QUALITY PROTEIN: uncharacterized protein n=1 Tax=Amphiura filiformis TaxID=82378 RepID=UPI003B20F98B